MKELDKTNNRRDLVDQEDGIRILKPPTAPVAEMRFLLNIQNGRVLAWSPTLDALEYMIPCNPDGSTENEDGTIIWHQADDPYIQAQAYNNMRQMVSEAANAAKNSKTLAHDKVFQAQIEDMSHKTDSLVYATSPFHARKHLNNLQSEYFYDRGITVFDDDLENIDVMATIHKRIDNAAKKAQDEIKHMVNLAMAEHV